MRADHNLLPCPFCGGEAREVHYSKWGPPGNLAWLIHCTRCHAMMAGTHHDMNRAAWNTRMEPKQGRLEP